MRESKFSLQFDEFFWQKVSKVEFHDFEIFLKDFLSKTCWNIPYEWMNLSFFS